MFGIFEKKKFLVDYLGGFVDIHNHILPGIDDGAKTVEESIELIQGFMNLGVQSFIATPHIMQNYYPNTPATIKQAYIELRHRLFSKGLRNVTVRMAAEHMIDANFEILLEEEGVMPLQKEYLLVEMSYLQPSINFDQAIQKIASHRFFPILAHPERYIYLHSKFRKYAEYKEQGILFQLNLLSLSEFYGKDVQQAAIKLLEEGHIDFAASDVHNKQQLEALKEVRITEKLLSKLLPVLEATIYNFY